MTINDELLKPIIASDLKVVTFDLETAPHVAYTFDLRADYISPDKLVEPGRVICWAAKVYGQKKVHFGSEHHDGREGMIRGLYDILDGADILVGFNSKRFDTKHAKREFFLAGLPPLRPHKHVDLLLEFRKQFAFASNKLDYVSQQLGVGEKIKHEGFGLWRSCLAGDDKAWARMRRYCIGDVRLTETLYDRLRPWITSHPHVNSGEYVCPRCGSADLDRAGDYRADLHLNAMYRCGNCLSYSKAGHLKRIALTRAVH